MAALSIAQLEALAQQVGLTPQESAMAASIAKAESGGRPDAVGDVGLQDKTWGPSIGLWQVRSVKAQSGTGGTRDATQLKDPVKNAQSMAQISSGGSSWKAWSTYTNGSYKQFLADAQNQLGSVRADQNFNTLTQDNATQVQQTAVQAQTVFLGEDTLKGWLKDYHTVTDAPGKIANLLEYTVAHAAEFTIRGIQVVLGFQLLWMGSVGMLLIFGMNAANSAPEPLKKGAKIASFAIPELDVVRGAKAAGAARMAAKAAR